MMQVVNSYIDNDLLGLATTTPVHVLTPPIAVIYLLPFMLSSFGQESSVTLISSSSEVTCEHVTRLYNCMASVARGRAYMLQVPRVVVCMYVSVCDV